MLALKALIASVSLFNERLMVLNHLKTIALELSTAVVRARSRVILKRDYRSFEGVLLLSQNAWAVKFYCLKRPKPVVFLFKRVDSAVEKLKSGV